MKIEKIERGLDLLTRYSILYKVDEKTYKISYNFYEILKKYLEKYGFPHDMERIGMAVVDALFDYTSFLPKQEAILMAQIMILHIYNKKSGGI